jgi:drug/metabolite transporter (DMT)-like permease
MNLKVHLALLVVTIIYALVFVIAKDVMPLYVRPYGLIFLRVSMAAVLLWVFHTLYVREKVERKDAGLFLLCAVFGVATNMLLFFKGLAITTPINGAVIMVTTPILVTLLSLLVLKEKFKVYHWIGIALGFLGAFILMSGFSFTLQNSTAWGDFYVFVNAVSYSVYLVIAKPLVDKYHPVTILKWIFLIGAVFVLPFSWQDMQEVKWQSIPYEIVLEILFLGIFATFVTYLLNGWAMQKANPALVGFYIYLQPVFTTFIAILRQKDTLTATKVLAAVLIFVGVYLVNMNKIKAYREKRK